MMEMQNKVCALGGVIIFLCNLMLYPLVAPAQQRNSEIIPDKYAIIVVDYNTGKVIRSEHADALRHPASLTKLMTLYLVFAALDKGVFHLNDPLIVSAHAAHQKPSKLALRAGQTITVQNAILGVVTKSANDAATVLGEALGNGSETEFAERMTEQAKRLGMTNTRFYNASGLPHPQQYTTAADMARLSRALIKDFPRYYTFFSTKTFVYNGQLFTNHNRLMNSYAGMDGLKTGYIRDSGFNLVASAVRQGQRLVAVIMGGRTARLRDRLMSEVLDKSFETLATPSSSLVLR